MNNRKLKRIIKKWENKGKPVPPPHEVKQSIIKKYAQTFNINTFIETGTFRGEMLEVLKDNFKELYSVELSEELYKLCTEKLKKYTNIHLFQGDSSVLLPEILKKINTLALFWLDAHYSGGKTAKGESDTPILNELNIIISSQEQYVILIDDARCFGNEDFPDYPSIEELKEYVLKLNKNHKIQVEDDIIRIIK